MEMTTIKISKDAKRELDRFREHPAESYDQVIRKMTSITKNIRNEPKLSQETIKRIEESRERTARGEFLTEDELWRRLGFDISDRVRQRHRATTTGSAAKVHRSRQKKNA